MCHSYALLKLRVESWSVIHSKYKIIKEYFSFIIGSVATIKFVLQNWNLLGHILKWVGNDL